MASCIAGILKVIPKMCLMLSGAKDGKKSQAAGKVTDSKSNERVAQLKSQEGKKHGGDSDHAVGKTASVDRPESHATDRGESAADPDGK